MGLKMRRVTRRDFVGISVGAVATLSDPAAVLAQSQCSSPYLPAAVAPTILTVDCASRRNFQLFRQNSVYLGLAGAVSLSFVRGRFGSFPAGNLFLFPWLKPNGQGRILPAVMPTSATQVASSRPIPDATLPLDEYFCSYVLQAPTAMFIGFQVDVPYRPLEARFDWFTNVDQLADGKGVGIDWTSSNLNHPWFGGSRFIPNKDQCNGLAWRKLIVDGLNQAAAGLC
jgi:hypothetical protein